MLPIILLALGTAWLPASRSHLSAADIAGERHDGLTVRIDSVRHSVVLAAGPFELPPATGDTPEGGMDAHALVVPMLKFTWPVDGWIRGMKLRVGNAQGELPRSLVGYLTVINFGRRQLLYSHAERLLAASPEAGDLRLPATIGIPVSAGMPMALLLAWRNATPEPVPGATLELSIDWMPARMVPRPVSVLPVSLSVVDPVGNAGDFELPAGSARWTAEFSFPLAGHVLVAGGHLHDYGSGLELEDISTGSSRAVLRLRTRRTGDGRLLAVDRILPGAAGNGIRLRQGRRYRLVASYDNPTGQALPRGGMANLILLFAPDQLEAWPAVAPGDASYRKDLRYLESRGVVPGR